jgi:hypothetical protein
VPMSALLFVDRRPRPGSGALTLAVDAIRNEVRAGRPRSELDERLVVVRGGIQASMSVASSKGSALPRSTTRAGILVRANGLPGGSGTDT